MSAVTAERQLADEWLPDIQQVIVSTAGVLAVGILYIILPDTVRIGPTWLLLAVELVIATPLMLYHVILRRPLPFRLTRRLPLGLLLIAVVGLVGALLRFLVVLPRYSHGSTLFLDGIILWLITVLVFATSYWELDGGGPRNRRLTPDWRQDFQFPQQQSPRPSTWEPGFIDYIFVAFCFSTSFSPADTAPLTPRMKLLVMVQAVTSLFIIGTIIGRAIGILGPG
jgi:uncharacterized membrane protein